MFCFKVTGFSLFSATSRFARTVITIVTTDTVNDIGNNIKHVVD